MLWNRNGIIHLKGEIVVFMMASTSEGTEAMPEVQERYAQLPRKSIRQFLESASFYNLPENVFALLAEDSNYRLREILQNAKQIMKHTYQRKLTCEVFNNALRGSDCEPLLGYNESEPFIFKSTEDEEKFYIEDLDSVLSKHSECKREPLLPPPHLQGYWLSIEGVQPESLITTDLDTPTEKISVSLDPISDNLMEYYNIVTSVILGYDEKLIVLALKDLSINANISPLLPRLTNFVSVVIKKRSHDLTQLKKLLQTIESLLRNPCLYLGHESYIKTLVQSLIYCATESLAVSINPFYDQWIIRDTASYLLAKLLKEWSTSKSDDLYCNTVSMLIDIFKDTSKPFYSHYGVVTIVHAIGLPAVEDVILPYLQKYFKHLNSSLFSDNINLPLKSDAYKVYSTLLIICEKIICTRLKEQFEVPETETVCEESSTIRTADSEVKKPILQLYKEFYEEFGGALVIRLPYLNVRNFYSSKKLTPTTLFYVPELEMTDEELLEKFNEKDDDIKSIGDDHEADPVDFQVKSTVSDPAVGIKLTIAKLRRPQLDKEPSPPKKMKLKENDELHEKLKQSKEHEPPFESVPLRLCNTYIFFSFNGASPKPQSELKFKQYPLACATSTSSKVYQISKKLKTISKNRTVRKKYLESYKKLFLSGYIRNIL